MSKYTKDELDRFDKELEAWADEPLPADYFPPMPAGPIERFIDTLSGPKKEAFKQRVRDFEGRED